MDLRVGRPTPSGCLVETVEAAFPGRDDVRVIVRCREHADIRQVVRALRSRGQSVVGVHERFRSGDDPDLRRAVPSTDGVGPKYWVHQNKLIEGIDDPRFMVRAFYDPQTGITANQRGATQIRSAQRLRRSCAIIHAPALPKCYLV
jgi:hypothetical protein